MSLLFATGFDYYLKRTDVWDSEGGVDPINHGDGSISTAFGRLGTYGVGIGSGSGVRIGSLTKNLGAQLTTVICGFAVRLTGNFAGVGGIVNFMENGSIQFDVRIGSDGTVRVNRGDGTQLGLSVVAVPFNQFVFLEVKAVLGNGSGSVEVRVDETAVLTLTGIDNVNTANAYVTQFRFGASQGGVGAADIDDVYLCDAAGSVNNDYLGDVHLEALFPTADGTYTAFAIGGTSPAATRWQSVTQNPSDEEVTYVKDATVSDKVSFAYGDLPVGAGTIPAVVVNSRLRKETGGSRKYGVVARVGGSDTLGTGKGVSTDYAWHQDVLETKPGGGGWGPGDVDGAEFGVMVAS